MPNTWFDEDTVREAKADDWLSRAQQSTEDFLRNLGGAQQQTPPSQPALAIKLPTAEELHASAPWRDLDPAKPEPTPTAPRAETPASAGVSDARPSAASGVPAAMPTAAPSGPAPQGGDIDNSSRASFVRTAYPMALRAAGGDPELAKRMLAMAISENGTVGSGGAIGVGFNFGGIKYDPQASGSGNYGTWESEGGQRVNQNANFAAYASPQDGFNAIPRFIQTNFPQAWKNYQQTHDSAALIREINAGGYATDQGWHHAIEGITTGSVEPAVGGQGASPQAAAQPQPDVLRAALSAGQGQPTSMKTGDMPQPGTSQPIQNPDGSVTTERSITVTEPGLNGGRATNIPTVWDGRIVSDDEAVQNAIRSGIAFPSFNSIDEAVSAAEQRSRDLGDGQATSIGGAAVPPEVQNALPNRNRPVRGGPIDEQRIPGRIVYRDPDNPQAMPGPVYGGGGGTEAGTPGIGMSEASGVDQQTGLGMGETPATPDQWVYPITSPALNQRRGIPGPIPTGPPPGSDYEPYNAPPGTMYRQPIGAPTMGPDTTDEAPYDPRSYDQGAHETGYTDGGSQPSGGAPTVSGAAMPESQAAPATYAASADDPGTTPTPQPTYEYQFSQGDQQFPSDQYQEVPTRTPAPPEQPQIAQQSMPSINLPDLTPVFDAAGNLISYVKHGAEAAGQAVQGAVDQIGANMDQNRRNVEQANAATGYGQVTSTPGEPDYVQRPADAFQTATAPAAGVYGRATDAVNQQEDAAHQRNDEAITSQIGRQIMAPVEAIRRGVRLATAIVQATPEATAETVNAALDTVGLGRDTYGVDTPLGRVGIGDAALALAPDEQVQAVMAAGMPVAHGRAGGTDILERGANAAVGAARDLFQGARGALADNAERMAAADARMAEQPFTASQQARSPEWDAFSRDLNQPADQAAREANKPPPRPANDQIIREQYGRPWEEVPRAPATQQAVEESGSIARPRNQVSAEDAANLTRAEQVPNMEGRQNAVPDGWGYIDAGPGLAERAAQINLPGKVAAGRAIGAVAGAGAGAASAPDDATWDERTARALAGGSLGFMAGGHAAAQGTMGAARLIDSLISRGKLNPEILLDHPEPVTRIKALFGLAAEGLPDNAVVNVPGMAQFLARLHPDQAAELGPLLSGQATAGEVRQIVQRSLGQRFGQTVSEIVSDAVTGMGARGQRAAETRADTATMRGLPDRLQGLQDSRSQAAVTSVPTAFGRATETTDPAITDMVGQVARDLGVDAPRVFVAPSSEVNAAVMSGRRVKPIMVLTKGLGDANLTPDEMRALLTHELSHAAENQSGAATFGASPNYRPPTPAQLKAAELQGARRGEMLNRPVTAPDSAVPRLVRAATAATDDRAGLRWAENMLSDAAGKPRMAENDPARPSTLSRINAGSTANERIATELEPAITDAGQAGLQNELPRYLEDMHHRDILNDFYNRGHSAVMEQRQPAIDAAKARGAAPVVIQRMEAKAAADADTAGQVAMRKRQGGNAEHAFEATDARLQEQEARLKASGQWDQLQQSAQAVWDAGHTTLQRLADSSNVDPAVAADLQQRFPHYVPTVPLSHLTEGGGGAGGAKTLVSRGTTPSINALEDVGTSGERLNPIVAARNQTITAERQIQRNTIARAFAQMMDDATAVNPATTATNPATHRTLLGGGVNISYFENGKPVTMSVPKPIADGIEAATNMGVDPNGFSSVMKRLTRAVTSTLTAARASFIPVNTLRDLSDYATRTMVREGNNPAKLPAILGTWADEAGKAAMDIMAANATGRTAIGAATGFGAGALQGDENTPLSTRLQHGVEGAGAGALLLGANKVQTTGKAAEFLARGGGEGAASSGLKAGQRWYRDVLRDGGAPIKSPQDALHALGDWAHDVMTLQGVKGVNERMETVSRTAAMRRAESGGANAIESMIAGRDASVDFDRAGTVIRSWNGFIPFLNATVQGGAQFGRMFKPPANATGPAAVKWAKSIAGTTAAIGATLGPVMMATEYYNRSDPARAQAYDDVPQYVKDSGIVLMMPNAGSDNRGSKPNYLWLPTEALSPFVVGMRAAMQHADAVVPGVSPSAGRSDAAASVPWAPDAVQQPLGALNEALSVFYPVKGDSAMSIASTAVPPLVKQAIELGQNKDLFRGGTISSPSQDERASGLGHTVAHGANWLGQQMGNQTLQNITPSQVDYLTRQLPAYGDIASGASDMVKPSPYKQAEQGRLANEPFVGGIGARFVRDTGGANLERAQGQMMTPTLQRVMNEARMRPSDIDLTAPADYQNAPLTRQEQTRWQAAFRGSLNAELGDVRDSRAWEDPTTRAQAVKDAVSKARTQAAKDVLELSSSDIRDRVERAQGLKRRALAQ